MDRRYAIFADYFQFYLRDHGAQPLAPDDYDEGDIARRIKAAPHIVVIQPERNMTVPVEVALAETAPADDFDGWDHVAEASLDLPSGRLEIHECTGGSVDVLAVTPGCHRVRAYFGGLDTIGADGLEGEDRYRIVLWPAAAGPVTVLKAYAGE
jgi:hypothetical protein